MQKEFFSIFDISIFLIFFFFLFILEIYEHQNTNGSIRYFIWGSKRNVKFYIRVLFFFSFCCSGSLFFICLEQSYVQGMLGIINFSLMPLLGLFTSASFFVKSLKVLSDDSSYPVLTIYEWFNRKYNLKIPKITALMGISEILSRLGILISQFYVVGRIFIFIFDLSQNQEYLFIILFIFIVVIFSSLGGFRTLSKYDLILFCFFVVAILITGFNIFTSMENSTNNLNIIKAHSKIDFQSCFSDYKIIAALFNSSFPRVFNSFYQKIVLTKEDCNKISDNTIKTSRDAFFVAIILVFILSLFISCVSLAIYSQNQNLTKNEIFSFFMYHAPEGIKGIICGGIIMLCITVSETEINSLSTIIENDIAPVIFNKAIKKQKIFSRYEHTAIQEHKVSKLYGAHWKNILSGFIGIICLTFTINFFFKRTALLNIVLTFNNFYFAINSAPMLLTILGYKMKVKSMILGIICGVVVSFILSFLLPKETIFIFSLLANFIGIYFGEKFFKKEEN